LLAITLPSHDGVFARAVARIVASHPYADSHGLEALLRPGYPDVTVRPRELSGEREAVYVYRDGRYECEPETAWWTASDVGEARLAAESGLVLELHDGEGIFTRPLPDLRGRHFSDLVHPAARVVADAFFDALQHHSDVRSTIVVDGGEGTPVQLRFRAVREGDEIIVRYQRA
jgi:hypothetical protein